MEHISLGHKLKHIHFVFSILLLQLSTTLSFTPPVPSYHDSLPTFRLKNEGVSSGRSNYSLLFFTPPAKDQQSNNETKELPSFYIRRALYSELGKVADILIESFYNPSMLVRQYLYLSELSRLQGNFPYSSPDHSFFVACYKTANGPGSIQKDTIIGFVDVDARPGTKESDAPRPYLSDLAVHPSYRRIGVAQGLIKECENEVKMWGKDELYLRVERKNHGALNMYSKLCYEALDHHYFGVKDTTILLRRGFNAEKKKDESSLLSSADEDEELIEEGAHEEVLASITEDVTFVI